MINSGMRIGEIEAMIININNVQLALNSAAGTYMVLGGFSNLKNFKEERRIKNTFLKLTN